MPRKGENIYKRKDGRWEARYIKGYTELGKIRYGYCYAKTYKAVRQKLVEARIRSRMHEDFLPRDRESFGELCREWLLLNRNKVKESTYVKYLNMIQKHIFPQLGSYHTDDLTTLKIEEFSHDLLHIKNLSPKTVRDILSVVKAILMYHSKKSPLRIPCVEVIFPKEGKKDMRVLTRAEQERFVGFLLQDMDEVKFGILLALYTGMRLGEVCALRWRDISLTDCVIRISSTMQRIRDLSDRAESKTKILINEPKTNTSARVIPMTEQIAALCARWAAADEDAFILTGRADQYIEPRNQKVACW